MTQPRQKPDPPTKIGLIQMSPAGDKASSLAKGIDLIRQAAAQGAQIVALPELFLTPYFCQTEDHANFELAEPIPGPTTDLLGKLAGELGLVIVASLFERRAAGLYHNTAAVLDADGKYLGKYRKMHIPDDPLYYEKFYFTPGDLGFRAFDTRFGRIGVLVCWDQWYPEAARLTALQGADILFYPTAIGWHPAEKAEFGPAQHDSWELIQRSHAVANGCFVAAINRVGFESAPNSIPQAPHEDASSMAASGSPHGLEFWCQCFLCDPSGQILMRGSVDREEVLVVPIDIGRVEAARTHWPFLRDRRIDAYGPITQRFLDEPDESVPGKRT
jgi:N-carbamoylputrescine amidase